MKIAIIGAGNIGTSIALGLAKSEISANIEVKVTRRKIEKSELLVKNGVSVSTNNNEVVLWADVVIVAVQPTQMIGLVSQIKESLNPEKQILISVVTGVSSKDILNVCFPNMPLFRAMPNIAIALCESMTCIAGINVTREQTDIVDKIFNQLGQTVFIDEELIDAATVLAACGVAFSLRFIRAASQGGIEIGFDSETAQKIAAQTVKGAAALLLAGNAHPEKEIDKVTTPKGCTITGLNEMEHQGFSSALIKGLKTSYKRISEITE